MDSNVTENTGITDLEGQQPSKEYDAAGNLIVKLSNRAVATIKELDGHKTLLADRMTGAAPNPFLILKLYALFGMQTLKINGEPAVLPPTKNDIEVYARARLLTSRELAVLMDAYADEYMGSPLGDDDLKNSSTTQPE